MDRPLENIRILDLTQGTCGPYCTQILSDLGAAVLKAEPPAGDRSRSLLAPGETAEDGISSAWLSVNRDKETVTLDPGSPEDREQLLQLAAAADVVVTERGGLHEQMGILPEALRGEKTILLCLSGYWSSPVFAGYPEDDAFIQAVSGFMSVTGKKDGPFTRAGMPIADIYTGIYGAIAVLAGIFFRIRTGRGLRTDLSKLDVMLTMMPDSMAAYLNTGQITRPKGHRHQIAAIFQALRTSDGPVLCKASENDEFSRFCEALGLDGLPEDPRFCDAASRFDHLHELEQLVEARTMQMTMRELTEKMLQIRCAVGPLYTPEQMLEDENFRWQKMTVTAEGPGGKMYRTLQSPLRFRNMPLRERARICGPDSLKDLQEIWRTTAVAEERPKEAPDCTGKSTPRKRVSAGRPLEGIRILDLTRFMAGTLGVQILSDLGAEAIKVERADGAEYFDRTTRPRFGNTCTYYMALNRGKKCIGLNLRREEDRDLLRRLAKVSDVVTENFRAGVTDRLGIGYEDLRRSREDLIYCAVSGFGQNSPYRDRKCLDTISQAMGGFMRMNGEEGDEPVRAGSSVSDIVTGLYEAVGVLAALIRREQTGSGDFVDVAMMNAMASVTDGTTARWMNRGIRSRRTGNRDRYRAFFEAVPASDGAVMVDASEDAAFQRFMDLLGLAEFGRERRFADNSGRITAVAELEAAVFPLTVRRTRTELASACRAAGIPAAEVLTQEELVRSGYPEDSGMLCRLRESREGFFRVIGSPMHFDAFEIPRDNYVDEPDEHRQEILAIAAGTRSSAGSEAGGNGRERT